MSVYLIHFDEPYQHAQHYIGYANGGGVGARLREHGGSDGANLLWVVEQAGITWRCVRVWPDGTRDFERSLKKRSHRRKCPVCHPVRHRAPGRSAFPSVEGDELAELLAEQGWY